MLKYFDDFVKEGTSNNLLGDNSLGNNLLSDNSPTYIDNNINRDTKAKWSFDKDIIGNNHLKKNFRINIEDLFE